MDHDARIKARKAYDQARYQRKRTEILAQQSAYQAATSEARSANKRAWYEANREKILAQQAAYRTENPKTMTDEKRATRHDYYLKNKEKFRERSRMQYAARKKRAEADL